MNAKQISGNPCRRPAALWVSMLFNVILVALCGWLVLRPVPKTGRPGAPVAPVSDESPVSASPQTAQPFRWTQLESTNYLVYVSNLRAIGCPEQTLRDIITADVASLYAQERKNPSLGNGDEARGDQNAGNLGRQFRKPEPPYEALVNSLLAGQAPVSGGTQTSEQPEVSALDVPQRQSRVFMPVVFQTVDASGMDFNDQSLAAIERLRQSFVEAVGGPDQDPADPDYERRWLAAQDQSDDQFRALLGEEAFVRQQMLSSQTPPVSQ
jgi:hypothetical protein